MAFTDQYKYVPISLSHKPHHYYMVSYSSFQRHSSYRHSLDYGF